MNLRGTLLVLYFGYAIGKECPRNFYWDDVLTMCSKCDDFCYSEFNRTIHGKHICATSEQCAYKNRQISKQSCPNGTVYDPIKCTCENCTDCFSKIEIHFNCSFGAICNYTCDGTIFENTHQHLRSPHVFVGTGVGIICGFIAALCVVFVLLYRHMRPKKHDPKLKRTFKRQFKHENDIENNYIEVHRSCEATRLQAESEHLVISTEETQTSNTGLTEENSTGSNKDIVKTSLFDAPSNIPSNFSINKNDTHSQQTMGHVTSYSENQSSITSSVYDLRSTSYDVTVPLNNITQGPHIKTKGEHGHKTADEIEVLPKNLPVIPNIQHIMKTLANEVWVKRLISNGKFIRITFDNISLKAANNFVGQNTKLPSKHYECIHKSQAVKMY